MEGAGKAKKADSSFGWVREERCVSVPRPLLLLFLPPVASSLLRISLFLRYLERSEKGDRSEEGWSVRKSEVVRCIKRRRLNERRRRRNMQSHRERMEIKAWYRDGEQVVNDFCWESICNVTNALSCGSFIGYCDLFSLFFFPFFFHYVSSFAHWTVVQRPFQRNVR